MHPGLGLVIAGGAARGAWQAGVLRFVLQDLGPRLGRTPWPDIVSGTSVGALNGVHVAARDLDGVMRLNRLWREMRVERVYRVRPHDVATAIYNSVWASGPFALLDAQPLYELVRGLYPTVPLREAIAFGDTRAFIVSATELDTGVNTLFLHSHDPTLWLSPTPGAKVKRGAITAEHCLASAALPLLFEPVDVDGLLHVDGMLRQNTPVRPVVQTGVSHILVIGVDKPGQHHSVEGSVVPTFAFIAGKALNAVLMDPVDTDLRMLERVNELVRWGRETYGPEFEERLLRDRGVREIKTLRISPSEDLGAVARTVFKAHPPDVHGATWALLSLLADTANVGESDLLSYLLFDRAYTATIEELGYEDARRHEDVLADFLSEAMAAGDDHREGLTGSP